MNDDRLNGKDLRELLLWILVATAGVLFAFRYYFAAFPEAAVEFRVSRAQALGTARQFVAAQGQPLDGYKSTIVFGVDDDAKTYLERELGLKEANRRMAGELSVWFWEVRFFRPQQEEEYRVQVSPSGRITGYDRKVEEARAGPSLERAAALGLAEDFLRTRYSVRPADYEYLAEEANPKDKPNRRDWEFNWERRGYRAKDAPYRLRVTVQGDRVGGAEEFLKVPETWKESYKRLRSSNLFYNELALLPYAMLFGGALWVAYTLSRRGQVRWRGALKLGLFIAVLLSLMQLNEWPLTRAGYDTNSSYSSFVASKLLGALLFGLGSGLMVALSLPAADALYRTDQPGRLRLSVMFTPKGIRTKEFFRSSVIGICMAGVHIGFLVAFYLLGSRFGVWAPQDINYTNAVSTAFPWIAAVAIGLFAATSEEFLFRLFAIPFLKRVTGSRVLAVLLPAFAWSFLHSAYPQEPGYIRGIEVGIIGIFAGVVMLRWGILATLLWHYTVDAMLVSLFLLRSDNLYFKVSGAMVGAAVLVPLGVSGISYLIRRRFETDDSLLNRAEPAPDPVAHAAPPAAGEKPSGRVYDALTPGRLGFLVACGLAGAALLVAAKPPAIGDFLSLPISAREAQSRAGQILRARKIDPSSYRSAAVVVNRIDPLEAEYLRRALGVEETNRIYQQAVPGALWRVRYFRDSQKEEYAVILRSDGTLHSVHHTVEENAKGAALGKEDARARAETYLREEKHLDLTKWNLVEAESEKKPARTDHTLVWEEIAPLGRTDPGKLDAARARIELKVQGEEISGFRTFLKIPDEWRRQQEQETLLLTLYSISRWLLFVGFGLTALIIYLKNLKAPAAGSIPWRRFAGWAVIALGGFVAVFVFGNRLPNLYMLYDTAIPFKFMLGGLGVAFLLLGGLTFAGLMMLFGLAWFFGVRAFGEERLPGWAGMPASYYRDALFLAAGGGLALVGAKRALLLLGTLWPTVQHSVEFSLSSALDAYIPAAQAIGGALLAGLLWSGAAALAAGFVASLLRQRWMRILLFLLTAAALVGHWGSGADFLKRLLLQGLLLALVCWGVQRIVRFNLLAYFLLAAGSVLSEAALELIRQPNAFYRGNGYAVLLALIVLLAWPFLAWRKTTESPGQAAS